MNRIMENQCGVEKSEAERETEALGEIVEIFTRNIFDQETRERMLTYLLDRFAGVVIIKGKLRVKRKAP